MLDAFWHALTKLGVFIASFFGGALYGKEKQKRKAAEDEAEAQKDRADALKRAKDMGDSVDRLDDAGFDELLDKLNNRP